MKAGPLSNATSIARPARVLFAYRQGKIRPRLLTCCRQHSLICINYLSKICGVGLINFGANSKTRLTNLLNMQGRDSLCLCYGGLSARQARNYAM